MFSTHNTLFEFKHFSGRRKAARLALFCAVMLLPILPVAGQQLPALVSVNMNGTGSGNERSGDYGRYRITPDGRYVVFYSQAGDLVPMDSTQAADIFVRDLQLNKTTLVSAKPDGTRAGGIFGLISDNGRYVAFFSNASNIVNNDTNSSNDVFLRDLHTGTTKLVSVNASGTASGKLGGSELISLSPDGRFVTFQSLAEDLTPLNVSSWTSNIYIRDMVNNVTKLVSISADGTSGSNGTTFGGSTSADGRYVVFTSAGTNLVANDTNTRDIFLRDVQAGTTTRLTSNLAGTGGGDNDSTTGIVDKGGRVVVFASRASNLATVPDVNRLADLFIYDINSGVRRLITSNAAGTSTGNDLGPAFYEHLVTFKISDDTRFVTFMSQSSDLVTNDTNRNADDIFRYEVATQEKVLVSVNLAGNSGQYGSSFDPSISADGRFIAFASSANDLVNMADEPNGFTMDVFLRDMVAGQTLLASINTSGNRTGNGFSFEPFITANGRRIVFHSRASDLTTSDVNGLLEDVFTFTISEPPDAFLFSASSYTIGEDGAKAQVTVNRSDTASAATVDYATSDTAALAECNVVNGAGSSRCDYATTLGTLRFAAGESSKTIFIPIVDDAHAEGNEKFTVALSNASGASLGFTTIANITIVDNDLGTVSNPIDDTDFFIRQQYIDFLGREPDPGGLAGWRNVLVNCGVTVAPPCDRIEVSAGFFRSEEFQSRGYFIYRFFSALGRIPVSEEFYPDFAKVSGFLTADQLEANKAAYVNEVMARADFQTKYGSTLNNPTAYVEALLHRVGLPSHASKQSWIDTLNVSNTTETRGQVLRQLVESVEVYNKYYNEAFVIMQYFGYLRRTADASYLDWIQTMNQNGGDYRVMINGFMNSSEYRRRFGP
ncbi:MAG TPA: Calx-beta domain-containing protein [Pyrinomonadaceae bacterium]|nr:Calx-beta domain-containing protein [Pyrinomonadaceae bacterium]